MTITKPNPSPSSPLMAIPSEGYPNPKPLDEEDKAEPKNTTYGGDLEADVAEEEEAPASKEVLRDHLLRHLSSGPVRVRVHDVVIRGNAKTKAALIEAEVLDAFRSASSMKEVIKAAGLAKARLLHLDIFDSVSVTLDSGPSELPGTVNAFIDIVEAKRPLTGDFGLYSKPEDRTWSLEGSLKLKNLLGYGDIWDATGGYGFNQTSELSAGVSLPRVKAISTPLMARVSLLSQDWLDFSPYKERLLGLSVGLISTRNHDLAYNLALRALSDPSRLSSKSIRSQLGHSLLSSIKYTYKIDRRDSCLRPTCGYAFHSTSQVGGLGPDSRILRFIRQEFDLRGAFPLGFYNTALNLGVAAGVIMPWGRGFMDSTSPLPERFFMPGHASPVCILGGPASLLGFKVRGLGPTDLRRVMPSRNIEDETTAISVIDASESIALPGKDVIGGESGASERIAFPGRDVIGGDLAVTAFADLSFDLPIKLLREAGVHGHVFANAGNLVKLTQEIENFSFQRFLKAFRSSAGFGIIFPTRYFRLEINYCHILRKSEHDHGKTGIQFSFATP